MTIKALLSVILLNSLNTFGQQIINEKEQIFDKHNSLLLYIAF